MKGFVGCCITLLNYLFFLTAISAESIHLGGLFSPIYNDDYSVAQAEHLAAFKMAIDEINDKNDGLFDDVLPDVSLTFSIRSGDNLQTASSAYSSILNSFPSRVTATVNALPNPESVFVNQIGTELRSPQILSVSNAYEYNDPFIYPYVSKTVALESFEGMVAQNMLCVYFGAKKVAVVSSASFVDIVLLQELLDKTGCDLEVLAQVLVRAMEMNFASAVEELKEVGARYFLVITSAEQTAAFIAKGFQEDLFNQETVIITTSRGGANVPDLLPSSIDVAAALKGFFTIQYIPNYDVNRSDASRAFAKRWRALPSTTGRRIGSETVCNNTTDSTGKFFLYRSQHNASRCTGLLFADYDEFGFAMQPYTAHTYDATVLVALAIDFAVKHQLNYSDALVLQNILIQNISYEGVTGLIDIYEGMSIYFGYARGNRESGNHHALLNFNEVEYVAGRSPYVFVGEFSSTEGVFYPCDPSLSTCFAARFRSAVRGDYSIPPSDKPPPIYLAMSPAAIAILSLLGASLLLLVLACALFMVSRGQEKIIKASQPTLLYCILVGGLLTVGRIWVAVLTNHDAKCSIMFWLGHLAFAFIISALFVKSYRIHRIVNTKTIRRVKFSASHALRIWLVIIVCYLVYLTISQAVGVPVMRHTVVVEHNQETFVSYCSFNYPQFQTTLFSIEFVLLMGAFYVCYETRNVPDLVNESKLLSVAMSSILLICILLMPIIYLLSLPPDTKELIASIGFGLGGFISVGLLFVPKYFAIVRPASSAKVASLFEHSKKRSRDAESNKHSHACPDPNNPFEPAAPVATVSVTCSHDLLKGKPDHESIDICHRQLQGWQELLFHYQGLGQGDGSSNMTSTDHIKRDKESSRSLTTGKVKFLQEEEQPFDRMFGPSAAAAAAVGVIAESGQVAMRRLVVVDDQLEDMEASSMVPR